MNSSDYLMRKISAIEQSSTCAYCGVKLNETNFLKHSDLDLCKACDKKTLKGTIDKYRKMVYHNNTLILDVETSGVSQNDQIISLCLLNMKGEVVFHSYFKPSCPINKKAAELHGLNEEYLKKHPFFKNVFSEIYEYLNNNIIFCWDSIFVKKMIEQTLLLSCIPILPELNLHSIKDLYIEVEYETENEVEYEIESEEDLYNEVEYETESEEDFHISINECFFVLDLPYKNCYDSIQDAKNLKDMIDCILFIHHKEEGVV